jgi:hypothetical protein
MGAWARENWAVCGHDGRWPDIARAGQASRFGIAGQRGRRDDLLRRLGTMLRRTFLGAVTASAGLTSGFASALASRPPGSPPDDEPPSAKAEALDLLLVLAVDVSRSIDEDEALLQREGYRAAIASPMVVAAICNGAAGAIGLAYVEWAGEMYQRLVVPWMRIGSQADAETFAGRLAEPPRRPNAEVVFDLHTSISGGIEFSRRLLSRAPWSAARRVIDVSGDGDNNSGPPAEQARDLAVAEGIGINGLAISNDHPPFAYAGPVPLEDYYRAAVIGGPGAFVVVAEDFRGFAQAVRRKMIREIAGAHSNHHVKVTPAG